MGLGLQLIVVLGAIVATLPAGAAGAEGAAAPPTPIPDTPAGRRFADLMELTDGADEPRIAAYVGEHFTPEMRRAAPGDPGIVPFIADHARRFDGFEVVRVLSSTADQATMLVRPRSNANRWIRYIVKVEAALPHRVEGLFLMPASPGDIPQGGDALDPEAAVAAFATAVDRAVAAGDFSGVVLLARGEDVVFQRAAGEADRGHHVPVKLDTVFGLASMNKMFTAVAVGMLVEQGRISWNDPAAKHLRGWLPDSVQAVTVHQLLTHTSGLGDYLDRAAEDPKVRAAQKLSDFREFVRGSPVEPPSQGQLRYSNLGYVVLGAVIEAVTGRDYFDFVREKIFAPAGMTHTDSWRRDEIVENRAVGYLRPDEADAAGLGLGWRSNAHLQGLRGTSAGGGYSTAGDLLRFARALVEGRLVRRETVDALLEPRVRFPVGGDYGYGFVVHGQRDGGRVFGHAGGFRGVSGELKMYGDGEWTLVVLSNLTSGAGEIVGAWDGIAARLAAPSLPARKTALD